MLAAPQRVLLVGGIGQLGQSLAPALTYMYGEDNVLTTDIHSSDEIPNQVHTQYERLDALNFEEFRGMVKSFSPTMILHLSAILSGTLTSQRREGHGQGHSGQ